MSSIAPSESTTVSPSPKPKPAFPGAARKAAPAPGEQETAPRRVRFPLGSVLRGAAAPRGPFRPSCEDEAAAS